MNKKNDNTTPDNAGLSCQLDTLVLLTNRSAKLKRSAINPANKHIHSRYI